MLFSFLFGQLLLATTYICFRYEKKEWLPWILMFILCLTYYFDTDYFSYKEDYVAGLPIVGYKEPLYLLLRKLSSGSYILWRVYIWGTALLLFRLTCKRLDIGSIVAIYALVMFYAPLFAYGRVILAMTTYFYGFSFLAKPITQNRLTSYFIGSAIILLSLLGHRSILVIIALTPLFLIPLTKRRLIYLLLCFPLLVLTVNLVFSSFLAGEIQMNEHLSTFQETAERTAKLESMGGRNWKAELLFQLRLLAFYIPTIYIVWCFIVKKYEDIEDTYILKYISSITIIVLISVAILYFLHTGDTEITGKRYLFMSGIPLCLVISYLYDYFHITRKEMNFLVLIGFLCWEMLFIGYYISNGF